MGMRLIDQDEFNELDATGLAVEVTMEADGTQAPGPYLYCVNNRGAWVGRRVHMAKGLTPFRVAPIDTATVKKDVRWRRAAKLWLTGSGLDTITMVRRYRSLEVRMARLGAAVWVPWEEAYLWEDNAELMWDGLSVHPLLDICEHEGQRQISRAGTARRSLEQ